MMLVVGEHVLGEIPPLILRMTSALCGGIGQTYQDVCGALTSGVLIISGLHGRATSDVDDTHALKLAARNRERFLAELGSTSCGVLRERVLATGQKKPCASLIVERSTEILLQVLEENPTGK